MQVQQALLLTALTTFAYLSAFAATFWILMPVQASMMHEFPLLAQVTCAAALTHGVRVIATWLFRWRAVLFLLPGAAIQAAILTSHFGLAPQDLIIMSLAFATNSFLAFELARVLGWDEYAATHKPAQWRMVIFVGLLASLINAAFMSQVDFNFADRAFRVWLGINVIAGGTIGLVAWLLLVRMALRLFARNGLFLAQARYVESDDTAN